ncbi:MAG TPA: CHAT domain-containing protein [bacterium]|nr:CHAT domain-containing protein [bacterium]
MAPLPPGAFRLARAAFGAAFFFFASVAVTRAADAPFSQAIVDSLLEAERYDDVIALAQRELNRVERSAAADSTILDLRSTLMFCHFQKGDFKKAREIQESIVEMRAKSVPESDPQRADDLNDLAMICDRLGDDEAAAQSWRASLALLRKGKIEETAARVVPRQSALAETERRLGHIQESERLLVDAIAISEKHLPQDQRHARLLNNLGALLWDQRRFDEATRLLQDALRVTEADPKSTPLRVAVAHHNLANLKREQGDWAEAERLHVRALAIARERLGEDSQFPIFLKELAVLYADQQRFAEAFPLWDEALSKLTADSQQLLASEVLYERGRAYLASGNPQKAEASLRQCLAIREKKRGAGHPMIGQALAGLGTLEAHEKKTKEARRDYERAAAILAKSSIYPEERAEAEEGIARLDWKEGKRDAAITRLRASLDRIEDLRWERSASEISRADWIRRSADPTHVMLGWLADLGRLNEAVAMGERIRGRVLWDQMSAARVDWRKDVAPALRGELESKQRMAEARIRSLRRELEESAGSAEEKDAAAIETKLDAAMAAYRDVQEQSRAQSPAWSRSLSDAPPADLAARVQKVLAPGDLVLSYHVGAERSFVFEIPAQGKVRCSELLIPPAFASFGANGKALSSSALEEILEARGPAPAREALAEVRGVGVARSTAKKNDAAPNREFADLADLLIPPAMRERLLAASRVHLIPDGVLHELPFEVLPLRANAGAASASNPQASAGRDWLAAGPPICYGASLSTLLEIVSRPRSLPTNPIVLTVCDPDVGSRAKIDHGSAPSELAQMAQSGRWTSLPGTRQEADSFARAFSKEKVVRLLGREARESKVKELAPRARVLHFGTHGIVDRERNDLLAALVLSKEPKDSPEDGFLHLFEVYGLHLDSDLVVLSACETKQGDRVPGEGVFALSRGFFAAGARRVVASLWPVDDQATAALMSSFFAELGRSNDSAAALSKARETVRANPKWSDPFYWAPFVLTGSF